MFAHFVKGMVCTWKVENFATTRPIPPCIGCRLIQTQLKIEEKCDVSHYGKCGTHNTHLGSQGAAFLIPWVNIGVTY